MAINLVNFTGSLVLLLLVMVAAKTQFSYNKNLAIAENSFRLTTNLLYKERKEELAVSSAFIGPMLKEEFPDVHSFIRVIAPESREEITIDEVSFFDKVYRVDTSFGSFFGLHVLSGNPNKVLADPSSVFISSAFAQQHFGDRDPMGVEIMIGKNVHAVSGVFEALENSDFNFNILVAIDEHVDDFEWVTTLLKLNPGLDADRFTETIRQPIAEVYEGEFNDEAINLSFVLEPMSSVHFSSKLYQPFKATNESMIWILMAGTALLLFSAAFNYGSLSFSMALSRVKETGIRKLYGASSASIFTQHLGEAFIMLLISCALSVGIVSLFQNRMVQFFPGFSLSKLWNLSSIASLVAGLAGIAILSAFTLERLFLRRIRLGVSSQNNVQPEKMRRALLTVQLCVSFILIGTSYYMQKQIGFVEGYAKNFDATNVIAIPFEKDNLQYSLLAMKNEFNQYGFEAAFCNSNSLPGLDTELELYRLNDNGPEDEFLARKVVVDRGFFSMLKIDVLSKIECAINARCVFVNAKLTRDQNVDSLGFDKINGSLVVGVVKDFYLNSLYQPIDPMVFVDDTTQFNTLLVRHQAQSREAVMNNIVPIWKKFFNDTPLEVTELGDLYSDVYAEDGLLATMLVIISIAVAIVSFTGVLSLGALSILKRLKEFSIRRIHGATEGQVNVLAMTNIAILFGISAGISIPVIIGLSTRWLERYEERVNVSVLEILVIEMIICTVVVLLSFGQVRRSLGRNLIGALREN